MTSIIQIVSDDTSDQWFGHNGGAVLTPRLDSLAADGLILRQFHTGSSVCMPSRYNLLTGHHAGRCPAPFFRDRHPVDEPYFVSFNTHIDPGCEKTLGNILQQAGYRTGYVGKWHTGPEEQALGTTWFDVDDDPRDPEVARKLPLQQERFCDQIKQSGFDYAGGISWGNPQPGDRQIRELEIHNLEWMAKAALDFIEQCAEEGKPFYLLFALTTIHGNGHIESLLTDPRLTPEGYREDHLGVMPPRASIYERLIMAGLEFDYITAGMLWMDDAVGALLDKLEELGLADDTMVVYSSDHGPCEDKGTCYQGGTQIPCFLRWPAACPPGRETQVMGHHIDWLPTFAELAGVEPPDDMTLDGVSLLPLIKGERDTLDRDDLYFEFGTSRAVRTDRWKYLVYRLPQDKIDAMKAPGASEAYDHNGRLPSQRSATCLTIERHPEYHDPDQLYDLQNDPGETRNLAKDPDYQDTLLDLRHRLQTHLDTFDHPYPLLDVDPFFFTDDFQALTKATWDKAPLMTHKWWYMKWHHRPEEVANTECP